MEFKITIVEVSKTIQDINSWLKKNKGDSRALITELKVNLTHLNMAINKGVEIDEILDDIKLDQYSRLQDEGFNFNKIKNKKIPNLNSIKGTDLASWKGKSTEELVDSIYDKIRDLKISYPRLKDQSKIRWKVRIINIAKRIILLLRHAGS